MANRYWVTGGDGNWNSTTNWSTASGGASGASVPGSSDVALLDASSGSGTVTLDISPDIQRLTCTGFTGTLAFGTNTISLNSTGTIFTGATTMTVTGTPLIICTNSSATSRTISPTAVTEANSISFRITAGTGALSLTSGNYRDIDLTDGVNPTGYAGALTLGINSYYGNFKASTGMTVVTGTSALTFAATSGTKTINTAGVTFDRPFTFNGVGGTWQLQSNISMAVPSTRTTTLTNGTLDLNGFTLNTGVFSSNNSNVRSIAFGTGKIVVNNTSGVPFTMSTATNFTYTGTSRIELTASGSGRTFSPPATGAVESNALNIYVTTGSDTVTVSGAARFLNFDLTGFTGTLTHASNSRYFGDLVYSSGMTLGTVGAFTFAKTSGTQTITSNGKTIGNSVTVDAPGATVSLTDALATTNTISHISGTFTTNGFSINAGGGFNSSFTTSRTLNLGASTFTIPAVGTSWQILDSTNMTLNAGTSTIVMTGNTGVVTFNGGGLTYYNLTFGANYYNANITGVNTFNNLTIDSPAGAGRRALNVNANQTINGTLTVVGSAANSRPRLTGGVLGGVTITAAAVSLSDADFNNIIAAGASSPWSGTRLGNGGDNTNITFATPKTVYWNQPAGGNWSDVAWALTSGGAVGANNFPLSQDAVILDNTGVGASTTIAMDYGWFIGSLSAGSLTNALTINWNCFGNLSASTSGNVTLSSAITITYTTGALGIASLGGMVIITTAGVSIPIATVNFNSSSNTMRLGDNFTSTGTSTGLVAGTLDLNGKMLSCVTFDSTFTDLEVRVLAFNGGQIDVTGNAATVWACENLTNFSYTGTPTVNFTYSGSTGTRTINNGATGATESNVVDFNVTAGTDQWSATTPNSVRNLNFTGFSGTTGLFGGGFIYGNLTLSSTQTVTASALVTTFAATSGTKTITTNGVVIDRPFVFNGVGGTWSLQDALTLGATNGYLNITGGTFNTNNYNVTAASFGGTGTSVRAINLGSSTITVTGNFSTTVGFSTTTNLTFDAGTSTFDLAGTGVSTKTFQGGGLTFYKVRISGNSPTAMSSGNTRFKEFSNTAVPLTITFGNLSTPMYFDDFLISGTVGNLVTLQSVTPGTQFLLSKNTGGKVLVSYVSITDSNVTPAGYWFAPTSQGNVDGGNNTGWNFTSTGQNSGFMLLL